MSNSQSDSGQRDNLRRVPLWLKLLYSGFVVIMVPHYWQAYGPTNFRGSQRHRIMPITTTYLEMFSHPRQQVPPPVEGLTVRHVEKPSVQFYRAIYDAVGSPWNWTSRKRLSDAALAEILDDSRVEIHVLFVEGVQAGFAELDGRVPGEIELKQFGLISKFFGRGLGRYFLNRVIDIAFSLAVRRFWLHTCTEDHPAALPNYLKAGFAVCQTETHEPAESSRSEQ